MSSNTHHTKEAHGSVKSYVVGFILSIVFTLLSYWLVVHQYLSRGLLLQMILGFAVAQMFIQLLFFLHLGRGPKPLYNVSFFIGTAGLILVVVGGSIFIMNNLHYNMSPSEDTQRLAQDEAIYQVNGEKTGACQGTGQNHQVTIEDGIVSPIHTEAQLCDTLTFINKDDQNHDIAFGKYPQSTTYGGEEKVTVRKRMSKTITLNQSGSHRFYDEDANGTVGDFEVSQQAAAGTKR